MQEPASARLSPQRHSCMMCCATRQCLAAVRLFFSEPCCSRWIHTYDVPIHPLFCRAALQQAQATGGAASWPGCLPSTQPAELPVLCLKSTASLSSCLPAWQCCSMPTQGFRTSMYLCYVGWVYDLKTCLATYLSSGAFVFALYSCIYLFPHCAL